MKFVDGIKFGASFCIGWIFINALVEILTDPKAFVEDVERRLKTMQNGPQQKEERIIGFHM